MSLQATPIFGYDRGGLNTYKKPLLLEDQQWQMLENWYPYRERMKKREGLLFLGRLQRIFTDSSLGTTPIGQTTITFADIFTTLGIPEPSAELNPGNLVITIGAPDTATFTDQGNGTFVATGLGVSAGSTVNYITGEVVLKFSAPTTGGAAITANVNYFPSLPVMGITQYEQPGINVYTTIWFDTTYAYIWTGTQFQEFISGTTWDGTNSDFFWTTNYRGSDPSFRLFFATNFVNDAGSPMRYTDGSTWTTFAPGIGGATPKSADNTFLFQARILVPYFGRLLALNTWIS